MPPSGAWKPLITIEGVLVAICNLLNCPNPNDPLVLDIVCTFLVFYIFIYLLLFISFWVFRQMNLKMIKKPTSLKRNTLLKYMLVFKIKILNDYI